MFIILINHSSLASTIRASTLLKSIKQLTFNLLNGLSKLNSELSSI